ncbi:MAG: cation-transporting P-type ATPase, partial [Clostridia bacterium]|nr:cation-transporting P-type ATPase [Clostridia bacterium]
MAERWHDKTVSEVEELTGSNIQNGLSPEIAWERLEKNGRNEIFPIEHRTMTGYMADFSTNGLSLLLVLVSLISMFFKEYLLATSALILIGVSYLVTFMAYYSSRILLERAARNSLPNARVIRGGKLITVKQDEIVVGDLIQLSAGDIVPCDARIVSTNRLFIVETGITDGVGSIQKQSDFVEYRNVPPHMCFNMAWASTIVTKGSGRAIACEVGKRTLVRRTGKNKPAAEYHKL